MREVKESIVKLPVESRRQIVQDIPALCPDAFPPDGWNTILHDDQPRSLLTSLLDPLDASYAQKSENFLTLNDKSLRSKK